MARLNSQAVSDLLAALVIGLLALVPGAADAKRPLGRRAPSFVRAHPAGPAHRRPVALCPASKLHPCPPHKPRISPPGVATGAARAVSGSGATLTAVVYPKGNLTTYWFQFGLTNAYGARTPSLALGRSTRRLTVSAAVAGLSPLTAYHYRIVASSCHGCTAGTSNGTDATFTVGGFQNPVYASTEAPDPYVLDNGATHNDYWAFTTGNLFPILHSPDLVHWTSAGTALKALPAWVVPSGDWHPWAPSVVKVGGPCPATSTSSCYVMYYVGVSAQFRANCVATATATSPGGPYSDQGPLSDGQVDAAGRPLGCGDNGGYGMIDPSPFVDPRDGQSYLYVSEDFACDPTSTSCTSANSALQPTISVIPLASDRLRAVGPRVPLFAGAAGTWEAAGAPAPTVEGPSVVLHRGTYYLFYSGGSWHTTYGMGYATAPSATGPFTKSAGKPILSASATVLSPGGGDSLMVGPHGGTWLVYHGRDGSYASPRTLRIEPFTWGSSANGPDVPLISGPTTTPQPVEP